LLEPLIKTKDNIGAMEVLDKLMSSFNEQQVVSLATVEEKQPRVRPMTLIHLDGKFYMITGARGGKNAKKLQQIRENPLFEYYLTLKGTEMDGFIRGMGRTWEQEEKATKKKIYNKITWATNFFDTADHPDYVLLELEHDGFSYRWPDTREIHNITL
jgi:general stress protein 26